MVVKRKTSKTLTRTKSLKKTKSTRSNKKSQNLTVKKKAAIAAAAAAAYATGHFGKKLYDRYKLVHSPTYVQRIKKYGYRTRRRLSELISTIKGEHKPKTLKEILFD